MDERNGFITTNEKVVLGNAEGEKDELKLLEERIKDLKSDKANLRKEIQEIFNNYADRINSIETAIEELEKRKERILKPDNRGEER